MSKARDPVNNSAGCPGATAADPLRSLNDAGARGLASRSNEGFRLQARLTRVILRRFRDWSSVIITDGRGRVVTRAEDIPMARDGGIDLIITVRTDLPDATQKAVETRLRRILERENLV